MNRTLVLDVTDRSPRESQGRLLQAFDRALVGDTIKLLSDTGVNPVCQILFEEREGQFVSRVHKEAPGEWVAQIKKTR